MNIKNYLSVWLLSISALVGCSDSQELDVQKSHVNSVAALEVVKPVTTCNVLTNIDLEDIGGKGSKVTSASLGQNKGSEVCVVEGVMSPSITFKVQLPTETWTQRYMQLGCGGLCGRVGLMAAASHSCLTLENNNVVLASTDMGHSGGSGEFGNDPQKRIDFAYRAMHLTSLAADKVMQSFYGQKAAYRYFNGCSDGGREALMEAQRFPEDFDGIIVGAPAMNFSVQNSFHHGWLALSNTAEDGSAILHADKLPALHAAVLAHCDEIDGLKDNLIGDPRNCHFDPAVMLCKNGENSTSCLTTAEVDAVRKIYSGPHDETTGQALALGAPQPGSELSWPGVFVPQEGREDIFSRKVATEALQGVIFEQNPANFKLSDLKFTAKEFDKIRPLYGLYSAVDPDLSKFNAKGGKLILWHGWSDPHISPINSIAYYEAVQNYLGKATTDSFMKFYLFPGMYHCFGGDGPFQFDLVAAMMNWVEKGVEPYKVVASQSSKPVEMNGAGAPEEKAHSNEEKPAMASGVDRSRPVYPYPLVAKYVGHGSINDEESFTAVLGDTGPENYDWLGAEYYRPGKRLTCQVVNEQLDCN